MTNCIWKWHIYLHFIFLLCVQKVYFQLCHTRVHCHLQCATAFDNRAHRSVIVMQFLNDAAAQWEISASHGHFFYLPGVHYMRRHIPWSLRIWSLWQLIHCHNAFSQHWDPIGLNTPDWKNIKSKYTNVIRKDNVCCVTLCDSSALSLL